MDLKQLQIQKEIAKSYDVEKEMLKEIEKDIKADEEIVQDSLAIADALVANPKVKVEIDGRPFMVAMKIVPKLVKKMHLTTKEVIELPEDHIFLIIADINKYNLTGGKYKPFTAEGKIDQDYNLRDNVRTVVEGFIRHITGNIKPEILE